MVKTVVTMADIFPSTKFNTQQKQFHMASDGYVLLRLVMEGGTYTVMTATAAEDDGKHVHFPKQEMLIQATAEAFSSSGRPAQYKTDAWGRAYVEFREIDSPALIRRNANRVAEALGLGPVTAPWSDEELRDIWYDHAIDDGDDDVYLSDGMWLTRDGHLIER